MKNAEKFRKIFKEFATEVWAFPEKDFLTWLNAEYEEPTTKNSPEIDMAIKIIKADDLAPYSVDDILKARDLAVEALKQMGTTKNDSKFCPDRKAKTTHMETLLHCVEDECVAYKDGKCLKYNSDYEPTTKNNSSELEKNSKKLEKDFGEWDCISRQATIDAIRNYFHDEYYQRTSIQDCRDCFVEDVLNNLPSVTPQLSVPEITALAEWTEKLTKASEDAYNKGYADGMKAQEPRKGHWIYDYTSADGHRTYHCSECGCYIKPKHSEPLNSFNWCSLCGADMREGEE